MGRSEGRSSDVVSYRLLMNFRGDITQVAGQKADDEALKKWRVLRKWVLCAWISLSRSLEVKGKEAEDNLMLTTNKVESEGRKARSWSREIKVSLF